VREGKGGRREQGGGRREQGGERTEEREGRRAARGRLGQEVERERGEMRKVGRGRRDDECTVQITRCQAVTS
jgi:hypothetical protein